MATKRLKVADVERTIMDMACGASGGDAILTDDFPSIQSILEPEGMQNLAFAIRLRYFSDKHEEWCVNNLLSITNMPSWRDFRTLAEAIVATDAHIKKKRQLRGDQP